MSISSTNNCVFILSPSINFDMSFGVKTGMTFVWKCYFEHFYANSKYRLSDTEIRKKMDTAIESSTRRYESGDISRETWERDQRLYDTMLSCYKRV